MFTLTLLVILSGNYSEVLGQNVKARSQIVKAFPSLQHTLDAQRNDLSALTQKAHQTMVDENIRRHMRERHQAYLDGKTIAVPTMKTQKNNASGTGSIAGTVYASDGVTPVSGSGSVSITVYDEFGDEAGYTGLWSIGGTYSVTGLSAGKYYVQVEQSGNYQTLFYNGVTDWRNATLVNVLDGQQTGNINFQFKVPPLGAISGRITNGEGKPIGSCAVIVYDMAFHRMTETFTNADGYYVAEGLTSGVYKLEAADYFGSEKYSRQWYVNGGDFADATPVTVTEPLTQNGINIVLERGGAIAGTILDADANPVLSNNLFVFAIEKTTGYNLGVETNGDGTFLVDGLRSGSYIVFVSSYGNDNYLDYVYENASDTRNAKPITVAAPDTAKNIKITLQKGGVVGGTVRYSDGPANGTIEIYDENKNRIQSGVLASDNTFLISKLPTARYKLHYSIGSSTGGSTQPANQWYSNAATFAEAATIAVKAPDTLKNIVLTLQRGGSISGRVLGPGGVPLSYAGTVDAYTIEEDKTGSGNITDLGNFTINGLGTGEYKLRLHYTGNGNYIDQWYPAIQLFEKADTIRVVAPAAIQNIAFTVQQNAALCGYVADEFHNRISQSDYLEQNMMVFDGVNGEFIQSVPVTFIAGFQTKLLGGKYKISIVSTNTDMSETAEKYAVTYYDHGAHWWDAQTETLDLGPGYVTMLSSFVVQIADGVVEGTFFEAGNRTPLTDFVCIVVAYDTAGYVAGMCGNIEGKTGEYRLSGLRPGKYYLNGIATDWSDVFISQWYDTISTSSNNQFLSAKVILPQRAKPVTVGNSVIQGIDFFIRGLTGIQKNNSPVEVENFALRQNYPNPFNPTTVISYQLPVNSYVTLKVYDLLGSEVATLVNERKDAGQYSVQWNASAMPSGIYFYRIHAGDFVETKKLLLLK
jgi:hypothetical protein